jgi:diadenosine tetraphosphate (Ap4A) HIT family hydrolase
MHKKNMSTAAFYWFGSHRLPLYEVFYQTALSMAFVNLRPVVRGHVLVSPKRVVARFADLTDEECADLMTTMRRVAGVLTKAFECPALTITVQDGPAAGQTVPHVHVHVLPRRSGDFHRNDDIYYELDDASNAKDTSANANVDSSRRDRSPEELIQEADYLRAFFAE